MAATAKKDRYDGLFKYYGGEFGIDWRLLKAQAMAESALHSDAVSTAGAKGLAQFMDPTWKDAEEAFERTLDVFNPEHAIMAQAWYMQRLFKLFPSQRAALAAYNWGMGHVRRAQEDFGAEWFDHVPNETENYVARIERLHRGIDA